jgi:thiamine pyrophosphokinase
MSNNPLSENDTARSWAGTDEVVQDQDRSAAGGDLAFSHSEAEDWVEYTRATESLEDASRRILIFTGGTLGEWALGEVRSGDILIGADRGALFLVQHGFRPDLSLGDFDSVTSEELEAIKEASFSFEDCDPIMKDWTDTEMAFSRALDWFPTDQPPQEIVLFGALGSRFDHSLANVHLLRKGLEREISCRIVDSNNEVCLIGVGSTIIYRGDYTHISLLPLTLEVHGITLVGFVYSLLKASLTIGQSLGISNILQEPSGRIEVSEGLLLVIQSKD